MFVKKGRYTMRQMAYAKQTLSGKGIDKQKVALDLGYSPNVARSVASHIENKPGYHNAMTKLAYESNNLALAAIHEFQARGFDDFTNAELTNALNAIAGAWSKFNVDSPMEKSNKTSGNRLRTIILQQVENQSISTTSPSPIDGEAPEVIEVTPEEMEEVVQEEVVEPEKEEQPEVNDDPNDF